MIWTPHVTVAAVIEQDSKFLLVEEHTEQGLRFNQPAGHWEQCESLQDAAAREVLEESAYKFKSEYLIGIYSWKAPANSITYLRFAFGGRILRTLDDGIVRAAWLTVDEIRANQTRHRSPLLLQCNEDHLAGKRYPLDLLNHYA